MFIKQYGIFTFFKPNSDLRSEGLGRYLAWFVKGATENFAGQIVVVCPSWSHNALRDLFDSEMVPSELFSLVSPPTEPFVLQIYNIYLNKRSQLYKHSKYKFLKYLLSKIRKIQASLILKLWNKLATAVKPLDIVNFILLASLITPLIIFFALVRWLTFRTNQFLKILSKLAKKIAKIFAVAIKKIFGLTYKTDGLMESLYESVQTGEINRLISIIESLDNVCAWYSPTAFWPEFNRISKPHLMCVPDVVTMDFPVGFSSVVGDRGLQNLNKIYDAIRFSDHLVTYSNVIKWETLVDRFSIPHSKVFVVHHSPPSLKEYVQIMGTPDDETATLEYCKTLFLSALTKNSIKHKYIQGFSNSDVKFIFYASQFRPNKNLLTLLKAYKYVLRHNLLGYKLILTGNPAHYPEIRDFIFQHRLENEVLCLHGLSTSELAACYKLASLAVNPSLSEGGCPFTFGEALSVGTPVIMSRIAVTKEILNDQKLDELMFFDPFNWKDMAQRITWALSNQQNLLEYQMPIYDKLSLRSWSDVAAEHFSILDKISEY